MPFLDLLVVVGHFPNKVDQLLIVASEEVVGEDYFLEIYRSVRLKELCGLNCRKGNT